MLFRLNVNSFRKFILNAYMRCYSGIAMDKNEFSKTDFQRLQNGEQSATEICYRELRARFLHIGHRFLHDEHAANEAFDDAFQKLLAAVKGAFQWQGTAQLFSYFKRTLQTTCLDRLRREHKQKAWATEHLLPAMVEDLDGEPVERVSMLGTPSKIEQEARRQEREQTVRNAFRRFEERLTPRECQLLAAYRELLQIPGSDGWSPHQKTHFLQQQTGLTGNVFYVNHSRFASKAKLPAHRLGILS